MDLLTVPTASVHHHRQCQGNLLHGRDRRAPDLLLLTHIVLPVQYDHLMRARIPTWQAMPPPRVSQLVLTPFTSIIRTLTSQISSQAVRTFMQESTSPTLRTTPMDQTEPTDPPTTPA